LAPKGRTFSFTHFSGILLIGIAAALCRKSAAVCACAEKQFSHFAALLCRQANLSEF
jgi:hypothetical protein